MSVCVKDGSDWLRDNQSEQEQKTEWHQHIQAERNEMGAKVIHNETEPNATSSRFSVCALLRKYAFSKQKSNNLTVTSSRKILNTISNKIIKHWFTAREVTFFMIRDL